MAVITKYPFTGTSRRHSDRVIIYLPGHANNGRHTIADLLPALREYGDVRVVDWPVHGFHDPTLYSRLIEALEDYSEVVILASSMGGLLVDPLLQLLERCHPAIMVKGVAICALISGSGTPLPVERLASFCYWPLASRPVNWIIDWFISRRDKLPIEPAVRKEYHHWHEHRRLLRVLKASARREQLRFIAQAMPTKSSHPKCWWIYLRARQVTGTSDGFVKGNQADAWVLTYPYTMIVDCPELRHCTLVEQPEAWAVRILKEAFVRLEVDPLWD